VLIAAVLSLATGLLAPWRWTVVVWPAVAIAVGLLYRDPPNYDMPGFARTFGVVIAAVALVAWLLGRGIRVFAVKRGW
jgi:hypothetical protein